MEFDGVENENVWNIKDFEFIQFSWKERSYDKTNFYVKQKPLVEEIVGGRDFYRMRINYPKNVIFYGIDFCGWQLQNRFCRINSYEC